MRVSFGFFQLTFRQGGGSSGISVWGFLSGLGSLMLGQWPRFGSWGGGPGFDASPMRSPLRGVRRRFGGSRLRLFLAFRGVLFSCFGIL